MRASIVIALLAVCFVAVNAQVVLNQNFTISVVGSFRHDIAGFVCDYCDCSDDDPGFNGNPPCSTWHDNIVCNTTAGPDDNQQRWGNGLSTPTCVGDNSFTNSGVGFQGVTDVRMQANDAASTRIGLMTHYNNVINPPTPKRMQLYINMSAPELSSSFQTVFPLSFIETTNRPSGADTCDPSIQRSNLACDDRFSFDDVKIVESFLSNNVRYTLIITGFIQPGGTEPINQFITQENLVSTANVFAKIVTFCEAIECDVNYEFQTAPVCACVCVLSNKTCNDVFGDHIAVNTSSCACECARDESECDLVNEGPLNRDTCSCGCNITTAFCKDLNPLWEASLIPGTCDCACNRQRFIECRAINPFFAPVGEECECFCGVSNEVCKEVFGNSYRANKKKCSCFVPGEDTGLTDAEIAGIVVASVVGPLLIIAFIILLAAVLAYLIMKGYIPGIYGYKIAQGNFAAGGNSSLYADPWTSASNAAG